MRSTPISMLFGGVGGIILGTLFKFRALPFLKGDTMLRGGKEVSTAEFASSAALLFYALAAACIIGSIIWLTFRARKKTA